MEGIINDENINKLKGGLTMTVEYACRRKITDPYELRKIDERINDPNILTGKEAMVAFFEMMGMDSDLSEIFDRYEGDD